MASVGNMRMYASVYFSTPLFAVLSCFLIVGSVCNTADSHVVLFLHGLNFLSGLGVCLCCCFSLITPVCQEKGRPRPSGTKGFNNNFKPIKGRVIREGAGDVFDSIESILNAY